MIRAIIFASWSARINHTGVCAHLLLVRDTLIRYGRHAITGFFFLPNFLAPSFCIKIKVARSDFEIKERKTRMKRNKMERRSAFANRPDIYRHFSINHSRREERGCDVRMTSSGDLKGRKESHRRDTSTPIFSVARERTHIGRAITRLLFGAFTPFVWFFHAARRARRGRT